MEIESIYPFIWALIIIIPSYLVFHKFSGILKEKAKATHTTNPKGSAQIDQQFDKLIENAPELLNRVNREIEEQRDRGVADEQQKGLIQKKGMLEFVTDNKEVIEMLGKPLIKKVLSVVNRF